MTYPSTLFSSRVRPGSNPIDTCLSVIQVRIHKRQVQSSYITMASFLHVRHAIGHPYFICYHEDRKIRAVER